MNTIQQHNKLLQRPLESVGNEDINTMIVSLEDEIIGKLIKYTDTISVLEVEINGRIKHLQRPSESLRKLSTLSHSPFCGKKNCECLACFVDCLIKKEISTSVSLSRSSSLISNHSIQKSVEMNPHSIFKDSFQNNQNIQNNQNNQNEVKEQKETIENNQITDGIKQSKETQQNQQTNENEKQKEQENQQKESKPIEMKEKENITNISNFQSIFQNQPFQLSQHIKMKPPKNYPMIELKPECFPFPQQFLIPPKNTYKPKKITLHALRPKKTEKTEVVEEQIIHEEEPSIYITEYSFLHYLQNHFKNIDYKTMISVISNEINNYSYDFGISQHSRCLCDYIEVLRNIEVIYKGLQSGKLALPNEPIDPIDKSFTSQLLSTYFIPPMSFIDNQKENDQMEEEEQQQNQPKQLQIPKILLGATRQMEQQKEPIETMIQANWNILHQWEKKELAPYSYRKDVHYLLVAQTGIHQDIIFTFMKELEFIYSRLNLGKLIKDNHILSKQMTSLLPNNSLNASIYNSFNMNSFGHGISHSLQSGNIFSDYVNDIFDQQQITQFLQKKYPTNQKTKHHFNDEIEDVEKEMKKYIVLYDSKEQKEEEVLCKILATKCELMKSHEIISKNILYIPIDLLTSGNMKQTAIRLCLEMYSSVRRYQPSLYLRSISEQFPVINKRDNLLNEPLFVISPQQDEYTHKIVIGYKKKHQGYISIMMNYTGELQEVEYSSTIQDMWKKWISFIQQTTRNKWEITFTKIGDLNENELEIMKQLKEQAMQQFEQLIHSITFTSINVYGSMKMKENEYQFVMKNKCYYKINDQYVPQQENQNTTHATYYSLIPSLIGNGNNVGGYTVHFYENEDENEIHKLIEILHNLSYLNSDILKNERWSFLPKHLHLLQKFDLYMDLTHFCTK